MSYLAEHELSSGETVEIHRCNQCNGVLGIDSSFIDQVNDEVKCPMCENKIVLGDVDLAANALMKIEKGKD